MRKASKQTRKIEALQSEFLVIQEIKRLTYLTKKVPLPFYGRRRYTYKDWPNRSSFEYKLINVYVRFNRGFNWYTTSSSILVPFDTSQSVFYTIIKLDRDIILILNPTKNCEDQEWGKVMTNNNSCINFIMRLKKTSVLQLTQNKAEKPNLSHREIQLNISISSIYTDKK